MGFLVRVIFNAIAVWLADVLVSGIYVTPPQTDVEWILTYVIIGLIFGLVNLIVRPIVSFLSFPLYVITLGVFTFVVNMGMLWLTSWLTQFTPFTLHIDGFWSFFWGSIIISLVSWLLALTIPGKTVRNR